MSDPDERSFPSFDPVHGLDEEPDEVEEPITEASSEPSSSVPWWLEQPADPSASEEKGPPVTDPSQQSPSAPWWLERLADPSATEEQERPRLPDSEIPEQPDGEHEFHHPLDRVTGRLPRTVRVTVDWIVTIVGAVAIVLAIKAWVVNPYRIPSSSMEPTLHCARPAQGCEARFSDRVLANRFIYHFRSPKRGEIVVFRTPPEAEAKCGSGGTFVKRIIGLPGETVQTRLINGADYVYIDGRKLDEPYIQRARRDSGPGKTYKVSASSYFVMGDNRAQSCDSRVWGAVPRKDLIGPVFMTYWPPNRISFR